MRFNIETVIKRVTFFRQKQASILKTSIQALTLLVLSEKKLNIGRISNAFLFQEDGSYC